VKNLSSEGKTAAVIILLMLLITGLFVAQILTTGGTYSPFNPSYVSAVTKPVSGLTEDQTPASDDLIISVDVSDTSFSAQGSNKKVQFQYIPKGFASQTIAGATLYNTYREEQLTFLFDGTSGITETGTSTWQVAPFDADLIGYSLTAMQLDGPSLAFDAGTGVTLQIYVMNMEIPTTSATTSFFTGSGVSVLSSGISCFEVFATGVTNVNENDILLAYVSGVSEGVTSYKCNLSLRFRKRD